MSVALRNFAFEEFEAKLEHQRLSFLAAKLERERARVIHCCSHNTNPPVHTHIYTERHKEIPSQFEHTQVTELHVIRRRVT